VGSDALRDLIRITWHKEKFSGDGNRTNDVWFVGQPVPFPVLAVLILWICQPIGKVHCSDRFDCAFCTIEKSNPLFLCVYSRIGHRNKGGTLLPQRQLYAKTPQEAKITTIIIKLNKLSLLLKNKHYHGTLSTQSQWNLRFQSWRWRCLLEVRWMKNVIDF